MSRTQMGRKGRQFYCPVSSHIAWAWGLVFKECPVVAGERDMDECRSCPLRGNLTEELKKEKARPRRERDEREDKGKGRPGGRGPSRKEHKEQQK